jgi:hypothetical protein
MRTIVIAEPNSAFADSLAQPLIAAGYRVATCPGPWPPEMRCIRHDVGYCPLTEGADLLIYSPDLFGYGPDGLPQLLALDTAKAEPDVPLLLAWAGDDEPGSVQIILQAVANARVAARGPEALLAQVEALIGPPTNVTLMV